MRKFDTKVQYLKYKVLREVARRAWDSLTPEEEATLTDGCKIYLLKGEPVAIVPGDVTNLKITYPSDLAFAEAFAAEEDR